MVGRGGNERVERGLRLRSGDMLRRAPAHRYLVAQPNHFLVLHGDFVLVRRDQCRFVLVRLALGIVRGLRIARASLLPGDRAVLLGVLLMDFAVVVEDQQRRGRAADDDVARAGGTVGQCRRKRAERHGRGHCGR